MKNLPSTKTLFLFISIAFLLTGCKAWESLKTHTSFQVGSPPSDLNDTISFTGSIWGVQDMIYTNAPTSTAFGKWLVAVTENCTITIVSAPQNWNDTTTLRLSCHDQGKKISKWLPVKK